MASNLDRRMPQSKLSHGCKSIHATHGVSTHKVWNWPSGRPLCERRGQGHPRSGLMHLSLRHIGITQYERAMSELDDIVNGRWTETKLNRIWNPRGKGGHLPGRSRAGHLLGWRSTYSSTLSGRRNHYGATYISSHTKNTRRMWSKIHHQ